MTAQPDAAPDAVRDQAEPDTRQKLMRAAVHVFARKGFEGATVREICSRAKANVAAVNYHFGDKASLYAAVLESIFARAYEEIPQDLMNLVLDESADPVERLRAYVHSFFCWIFGKTGCCSTDPEEQEACADMGAVYLGEMARPTDALDGIVQRWIVPEIDALLSVMRGLFAHLGHPEPPPAVLRACAGSVVGQILHYNHSRPIIVRVFPDMPPVHDMLDELVDHVVIFTLGGLEAVRKTLDTEKQS